MSARYRYYLSFIVSIEFCATWASFDNLLNQISFGSERPDSVAARTVDCLAIRDRTHGFLQLNNPIFIIGGQSTSQLERTELIGFILCPREVWYIFRVFKALAAVARKDFNTQTLSPLLAANRIIGAYRSIPPQLDTITRMDSRWGRSMSTRLGLDIWPCLQQVQLQTPVSQ